MGIALSAENVVALASFVGAVNGKDVFVLQGESFARSDPVVKKFPQLFSKSERIEQATAAPGEKR